MKPRVALAMIVAAGNDAEAANLEQCLASVKDHVDAIYLQLNARKGKKISKKVQAVADKYADLSYEFEWTDNFVTARQDVFDKVPKEFDWVLWLDTDDIVENPENIRPSLAVMPQDVNGIYILYDYQKDEFGNVLVSHWNTRVVRNNGSFAWKSSFDDGEVAVHETLVAKRTGKVVANNEWKVIHMAAPEHYKSSLVRNIELLEGMAQRQSQTEKGVDPRILFYLGSHYNEAYRFNEALELFIEYLKLSGWAEERAEAHLYIGKILKNKGKVIQARNAFLQSMGENPNNPGCYLELGKLEATDERWQKAITWFERGLAIKRDISPMINYNYNYELYTNLAQALANLGGKHLGKALKMSQKAYELHPYDEHARENRDKIQKLVDYRNNMRAVSRLLKALSAEDKKPLDFLNALPESLQDSELVVAARRQHLPATKWPKRSIAIYAGDGPLGIWGPWSLDEGGIGGSEEAIVRLSHELLALGWKVTVYATPGTRAGIHDGVDWKQYWEINEKDEFDVLVAWRKPEFFDFKWNARKTYLWLHDVTEKDELNPERLANITKVIYVSKYHSERPENTEIRATKKLASGNGIDPSAFSKYDGQYRRDNHRAIYMSANERGLRILLDIWPDIKRAVPDATLTPYYGWHGFDAVNRDNPERMAWKATMVQRMKELPGVSESVRIGHDELTQEMFKSGVFAYPCIFPEVNCITAQKAQAAGCYPVVSDFAVLPDVTLNGTIVPMHKFGSEDIEAYKQALIHALKNPPTEEERSKIAHDARKAFDWKVTAQQWDKEMA